MKTFWEVLALGRRKIPGFVLVAVLVSLGTAASLVEPWIYRAIIDDWCCATDGSSRMAPRPSS